MKYILLFVILFLFSLESKGQTAQDKEAVKKVVIAFQEDFNDGSFKNAMAYTMMDWRHINPAGGIDTGQENVLKAVRAVHQTFLKGVTMSIESMDVRFITPEVAIADVIHKIGNYTTPDRMVHENEKQIKTYVIARKKGKWLLAQDHNTIIQTGTPTVNQK